MGQTTVQEIALSFNEYFSKLSNITQSFGNTIKYFYMKNIKINYEDFIKAYYFSIYSHGVQSVFIGFEDKTFYLQFTENEQDAIEDLVVNQKKWTLAWKP